MTKIRKVFIICLISAMFKTGADSSAQTLDATVASRDSPTQILESTTAIAESLAQIPDATTASGDSPAKTQYVTAARADSPTQNSDATIASAYSSTQKPDVTITSANLLTQKRHVTTALKALSTQKPNVTTREVSLKQMSEQKIFATLPKIDSSTQIFATTREQRTSSVISQTVNSLTVPTTPAPTNGLLVKPEFTGIVITIKLTISMETKSRINRSSHKTIMETNLNRVFGNITGFVNVTVFKCQDASVIVCFGIYLKPFEKGVSAIGKEIKEKLRHLAVTGTLVGEKLTLNYINTITFDELDRAIKDITNLCVSPDYVVINNACYHPCNKEDWCDHGKCYKDLLGEKYCLCEEDTKVVYYGKRCDVKAEKLKLESKFIIGIAVGSGGLLIVISIAVCVACRLSKDKAKNDEHYM